MPRLDQISDVDMEVMGTGAFQYSGAKMETLESSEYTLVTLVIDVSYSLVDFRDQLIELCKRCILAAANDPNSERIMYRIITFSTEIYEIQGFKPVEDIDIDVITFNIESSTACYDASYDGAESIHGYGSSLARNDFTVNAIEFVLTDGIDNASRVQDGISVGRKFQEIRASKDSSDGLESALFILVGMNTSGSGISAYLDRYNIDAGFDQYVDAGDLTDAVIKQIGGFVSKSVSSQSNKVGSGGPSEVLSF